jgi:hypothetical protein
MVTFVLLPSSGSYPSTIAILSYSSSSSIFIAKEKNNQTKKLIFPKSTKKELFPTFEAMLV